MKALIFSTFLIIAFAFQSDKPAYQIYNSQGIAVNYSDMLNALKEADIVMFGELHDNSIAHWMQYELTKDLFAVKKENLVLGAEMFEADNQLIIDEYLQGLIPVKKFEEDVRLWPNYSTDYKPLMSFAKENNLKFIGANIPRRYASKVFTEGFEGLAKLSDEAKKFIAPLPFAYDESLNCYKSMLEMGNMGMQHSNANLPKAQAAKDATMSYFILKNWTKGKLFIHYNGSYHSDNFEGIVWYLKQSNKNLNIKTIATVNQADISKLSDESKNMADFILCVPETMTKTH